MLSQLFVNGLISGSIYALIAVSFAVIYRTVKFFHLAHGIVYTVGAYIGFTFVNQAGVNPILGFLGASFLCSGLGIAIDRLVYYPLRRSGAPNLVFLIASFGVFVFIQNLIQIIYGPQIRSLRTSPIEKGNLFLGVVVTNAQILIGATSLFLIIVMWILIQRTRIGKAMRAVSDDSIGASVVGINPERTIATSFAIGSALAGAAGILVSLETNIEPSMGLSAILKGIIASILGGIGSIPGAALGGYFLGVIENIGVWKIDTTWKDAIAFLVLIVYLIFYPEGILGTKIQEEGL